MKSNHSPLRSVLNGRLLFIVMLAVVVSLLSGGQASAAPSNDNFASATVIASVPFSVTQNNAGATTEGGEPLPCGSKGATSWWRFTPTVDMQVTADTVGSAYDTVLAAYTGGAVNALTNLACNDDFSGTQSQVTFLARAGVTYRIQTGGKAGAAGSLTLNVSGVPSTGIPSLINYQGRLADSGTSNPVANGTYAVTFRIYDALTGGTQLWTETQQVTVSGGLFNVLLGTNTPLTASIFSGTTRFLEVQVGADPAMTPRQRLAAVPYAMQAQQLTGPTGQTIAWSGAGVFESTAHLTLLGDLRASAVLARAQVFVNQDGPDGDSFIFFYEDGSDIGEYFTWEDPADQFALTDDFVVNGNFTATGTKNAVVGTSEGQRLTYAVESTGVWFEDFGSGHLESGRSVVSIDSLFGETVNTDVDYHVFLTPLEESAGLYVAGKSPTSFEVRAANGSSDVAFDYRIVAKRRGYENDRLEAANADKPATGAGSSVRASAASVEAGSGGGPLSPERSAAKDGGAGTSLSPLLIVLLAAWPVVLLAGVLGGRALRRTRA